MIAHLDGQVSALGLTWVVIDVNGVGMRVLITPATGATLAPNGRALLHTSLAVREDSMTLYGFADADDRDAFELVQTASGVGPKLGLAIMSVFTAGRLRDAIQREDLNALCAVPGIGRKGAQKMVIELMDKVLALGDGASDTQVIATKSEAWREQVSAGLQGLGWSARDADVACDRVAHLVDENPDIPMAQLMRAALQSLARA